MTQPVVSADRYAIWRASTLGRITEAVEQCLVFDLLGPLHGKRVLDVGTGDGAYAIEASLRGAHVSAIDTDDGMLNSARERADQHNVHIELHQGRAEELPFDDASFDAIIAVTVLCFVPKPEAAVREMARALAPGGRLVLGELSRSSLWALKRRISAWSARSTWRGTRFWSRTELRELLQSAGLAIVDVRGCVFFPPSSLAARVVAPFEPTLTRLHAPGAAFLTLTADKPRRTP